MSLRSATSGVSPIASAAVAATREARVDSPLIGAKVALPAEDRDAIESDNGSLAGRDRRAGAGGGGRRLRR